MFNKLKVFLYELTEFKKFTKLDKEKRKLVFYAEHQNQWDFFEDIKCINRDVLKFANKINSIDPDSIVILQSDNGVPQQEYPLSFYNVNFWKLPYNCKNMLKDDFSNVNTFRIVFNCIGAGKWNLVDSKLIN